MKLTKQRVKNGAGTEAWHRLIEPYCRLAARHRGFMSAVARRMQADGFPGMTSQQVRHWLMDDPVGRAEPRYGIGVSLLKAVEGLARENKLT